MAKVSVIVPSRNERFLIQTVDNLFQQARGEIEVIAVIEDAATCWPEGWEKVQARHPNLHTIINQQAKGMRPAINQAAASAISRGAKYLAKFDAHCCFDEGWDLKLIADCDLDWVVVPRRKRLDPDTFAPRVDPRPDIDYHYLSFPDNVKDFGGPGLNGKVWDERARQRFNNPEYEIDDEMSSQGSGWFMHASYFQRMELMDHESYGTFWNEFQEIGLKSWLGGGQVKVNKRTWYAHWHKGSAGRGYILEKSLLSQGATYTKRWLFNTAWAKQTRPFEFIIERFWPVPGWPENWKELIYGGDQRRAGIQVSAASDPDEPAGDPTGRTAGVAVPTLSIHRAAYGISETETIDVIQVLRDTIVNGSLDIMVTNEALKVGNPYRGIRKKLWLTYSYNGDEPVELVKEEREWLIIGQSARYVKQPEVEQVTSIVPTFDSRTINAPQTQLIAPALIDKLVRKFNIPTHRLRGPMPIEVPSFHRNDLAQLFAELGFNKGAEIGVAEANYSEILCKANPALHLFCVDPWHHYSGNPQGKSKEKNEYAFNETKRKLAPYKNVKLIPKLSMEAVRDIPDHSLDFVYIDGHHGFDYVMQDLIEWSKKVRSGGIISGDDFYYLDPNRWGAGPVEAVTAYTQAHKINPWFIFNAHKSVDFMWVKQ